MNSQSHEPFDNGLNELKHEEPPAFHFERTMAHVRQQAKRRSSMSSKMIRSALAAGAFAIVVIGMLVIPVSYDLEIGSMVTVEFPVTELMTIDFANLMDSMENLVNQNLNTSGSEATLALAFRDVSADDAEALVREFLGSSANEFELTAEPIIERVGGNALAAITGGNIIVGESGMSDEEVEALIASHFFSMGAVVRRVDVNTDNSGQTTIDLEFESLPEDSMTFHIIR